MKQAFAFGVFFGHGMIAFGRMFVSCLRVVEFDRAWDILPVAR